MDRPLGRLSGVTAPAPAADAPRPGPAPSFHGALLGWAVDPVGDGDADGDGDPRLATVDGVPVAGFCAHPVPRWAGFTPVTDLAATAARIVEAGGRILLPASDLRGRGATLLAADPGGATFAVRQPGGRAAPPSGPGTLAWSRLTTRHPEEAKVFYGRVFGWTAFDGAGTTWAHGGRPVGGVSSLAAEGWPDDAPDHWTSFFAVPDLRAATALATHRRGMVALPPATTPAGPTVLVTDPAGAALGLVAPA